MKIDMKQMEIGIIGDTHVYGNVTRIPKVLKEALKGVDFIVHCGDLSTSAVVRELKKIAPLKAVIGNKADDMINFHGLLAESVSFEANGVKFLIEHGSNKLETKLDVFLGKDKNDLDWQRWIIYSFKKLAKYLGFKKYSNFWTIRRLERKYGKNINCVIFGHTHRSYIGYYHGILFLNPGDAQYERKKSGSLIRVLITPDGKVIPKLINLYFERDE